MCNVEKSKIVTHLSNYGHNLISHHWAILRRVWQTISKDCVDAELNTFQIFVLFSVLMINLKQGCLAWYLQQKWWWGLAAVTLQLSVENADLSRCHFMIYLLAKLVCLGSSRRCCCSASCKEQFFCDEFIYSRHVVLNPWVHTVTKYCESAVGFSNIHSVHAAHC